MRIRVLISLFILLLVSSVSAERYLVEYEDTQEMRSMSAAESNSLLEREHLAVIEADSLDNISGIVRAEPDVRFMIQAAGNPAVEMLVGINQSLKRKNGGKNVKVAILDTGIDYTHPAFKNSYVTGIDFVNLDEDPIDDHGHGTMVASILAANTTMYEGIAPNVKVYSVKVLDEQGGGYASDVIEGILWAVDHDVDIISMSFGANAISEILDTYIQLAYEQGSVLVAASGNTGSDQPVMYPAAFEHVIAVGSVSATLVPSEFSNAGPEIDYVEPGEGILGMLPGGNLAEGTGTSFSVPIAVGILSYDLADPALSTGSIDLGQPGRDDRTGDGLLVISSSNGNCSDSTRNGNETGIDCGGRCILATADICDGVDNNRDCTVDSNVCITGCTVIHPQGVYASGRVPFNMSFMEQDDVTYVDATKENPRNTSLCRDCSTYGKDEKKAKTFSEGQHELAFYLDKKICAKTSFFVDSKKPVIKDTAPSSNKYANGTFTIEYNEDALMNISLRAGNTSTTKTCSPGNRETCVFTVKMAPYEGKTITYAFTVRDRLHTEVSREIPVRVDSTAPKINIVAPKHGSVYDDKVPFNITLTEVNPDTLEYIEKPGARARRLCTRCSEYGSTRERSKRFSPGQYHLQIKAIDAAGNEKSSTVDFRVV